MQIQVQKTMILDVMKAASIIDALFKDDLIQFEPGVYFKGHMLPVLKENESYFREKTENGVASYAPVMTMADVIGSIYNRNMLFVTTIKNPAHLLSTPTVPATAMRLVAAAVQLEIEQNSAWLKDRNNKIDLAEAVREYLNKDLTQKQWEMLYNALVEPLNDVRSFIAEDKWIMHFVRVHADCVRVEKTIDYRIYDWHRIQDHREAEQLEKLERLQCK